VKKVVIHRFSLGGGNLELQLEGDATVAGIRKKVLAEARARDEKKYKVDFSMKKVRLFLSHFELVEDNIDLLIEKEIMTGRQQPGYAAERDYESRYHPGKELYDAQTVYDLCDMLQVDAPDRPDSLMNQAASRGPSRSRSPTTPGSRRPGGARRLATPEQVSRTPRAGSPSSPSRGKLSPERVASRYSPKHSAREVRSPNMLMTPTSNRSKMNATGGVALGRDDLSSPACSSQASSRSPSPLGKLSEFYNKNDYGRPTTPTAMVPPTFMRKEKLSAVLLSEDVPLSANTLRIPPAHRDLVTPGGGGSAGCRTRPGSSGGGGRKSVRVEVDPLGKNVSVTDDREVDNDEKFAALKWQKKPGSPNANNARKKPRRRVDEIHISAYVSVDWPLCMGPPVDVWKRRQRVVSGLTGTGTYSTKELVRRLMGVDGFNSGRAALDGPGAAATDNAGGVMIQPPQLGVFGGNMYLDTANDRGGPAHDMLRKSRSTTQIGLQTTLGRTLFSAHSGAARIVNMSRSVNPQVATKRPKTPLNRPRSSAGRTAVA